MYKKTYVNKPCTTIKCRKIISSINQSMYNNFRAISVAIKRVKGSITINNLLLMYPEKGELFAT